MSLTLIIGSSGSGKSSCLFERILEDAREHPKKKFYLLVPEQFNMETTRELVARSRSKAIMNVDVLSFSRLAYWVFSQLGIPLEDVLEDTGKNLLLRRVAQEHEKELTLLRGNVRRFGYIDEIKSLLTELSQYRIEPEQLLDFSQMPGMSQSFHRKSQDLLILYQAYRKAMQGRFITAEEILEKLTDVIEESGFLSGSVLALDGYTGFSPIQKRLIAQFLRQCDRVYATIPMDASLSLTGVIEEQELFAMSKEMGQKLLSLAQEVRCPVTEPILLTNQASPRFAQARCLAHLEQNLFRPNRMSYVMKEEEKEQIRLCRAASLRDELAFVGEEISRQVREKGARYGDFAIVCANLEEYKSDLESAFHSLRLPYYLDDKRGIFFHSLTEGLLSVLRLLQEDFSEESLIQFLHSGLMDLPLAQVDQLERYIHAKRIRGFARYQKPFVAKLRNGNSQEMEQINQTRLQLVQIFAPFVEEMGRGEKQTKERARAIFHLLTSLKSQERLFALSKEAEGRGDELTASIHRRIFPLVMELLEKMTDLLGAEELTLKEFQELFEAGCQALSLRTVPPSFDSVLVGDLERTRLGDIKTLYVLGASDSNIPKSSSGSSLFSQAERQALLDRGYELAPTDRQKAFMQRFYLYLALTKPSQSLLISYARLDKQGQALRKSYLQDTLMELFPDLTMENVEQRGDLERIVSPKLAMDFLAQALRSYLEGQREDLPLLRAVREQLREEEVGEQSERLWQSLQMRGMDKRLSPALLRMITGDLIQGSVSRMEQFAACAYAYFLRYGLSLQEREEPELDFLDMGNIYHRSLELFAKELQSSQLAWDKISREESEHILDLAYERAMQEMERPDLLENARQAYLARQLRRILRQTVWTLIEQVRRGSFLPKEFEMSFGDEDHLESLQFDLGQGRRMVMRGKIDRVDTCEGEEEDYLRIIDYKSGQKDLDLTHLYYGLQLQLVLYMTAAMEKLEKNHKSGKRISPAGLFYYHIDEPWLDAVEKNEEEGEEERQLRILDELRLSGIYNAEDHVLADLDQDLDSNQAGFSSSSHVIAAGRNKNGSLNANSQKSAYSKEELQLLGDFVRQKVEALGKEQMEGKIGIHPYRYKNETACDHCDYSAICGFEQGLTGMYYKKLKEQKKEEFLQELKKEQGETEIMEETEHKEVSDGH